MRHSLLARRLSACLAAIAVALLVSVGSAKPASATYHPSTYSNHYLYYIDGTYMGYMEMQVDYYTWSDGTESVSNMYAGLYRSYNYAGITVNWRQPDVLNYNGSAAYNTYWAKPDNGPGSYWFVQFYQGWFTVYAQYNYGIAKYHAIYAVDRDGA